MTFTAPPYPPSYPDEAAWLILDHEVQVCTCGYGLFVDKGLWCERCVWCGKQWTHGPTGGLKDE